MMVKGVSNLEFLLWAFIETRQTSRKGFTLMERLMAMDYEAYLANADEMYQQAGR